MWQPVNQKAIQLVSQSVSCGNNIVRLSGACDVCLHLAFCVCFPPSLAPPSPQCDCLSTWVPLCLHLSASDSRFHLLLRERGTKRLDSRLTAENRLLHISMWLTDSVICWFIHYILQRCYNHVWWYSAFFNEKQTPHGDQCWAGCR